MSQWHLKFIGWPWWLVLPLAAATVWAMWRWQRPELASAPPRARQALTWMRCTAVGLIVLLLLEPTLTRTTSLHELPLVGVMLDESGSMGLTDRLASPTVQLDEAVALGLVPAASRPVFPVPETQAKSDADLVAKAAPGSPVALGLAQWAKLSRLERASKLTEGKVLAALDGKARVRFFGFGQELRPVEPTRPTPPAPGLATNLEHPLAELSRQWAQDNIGAVLLLSDGRQTAGQDASPIIRSLAARGAVVSGISVGDPESPPDAAIAEIVGSHEAFRDEVIGFDVKYRVLRSAKPLWDLVISSEGKEIERRSVKPDGLWQNEHVETPASKAGTALFQVRIEPHRESSNPSAATDSDEATLVNNQSDFAVTVNQDPIRVYLADATPRWESRYLAAMFERDPRVKFERHYHSVQSLLSAESFLPKTQGEWDNQDLIVLGDVDSRLLTPAQQQLCADYVAKRGGFLVCVAGPRGMPRSFTLGPFAAVLPVKPFPQGQADNAPVSLSLTLSGRNHPITSIMRDPSFNERLWPALPPLQWIAGEVSAKPGAAVLVEAQNAAHTPIVALHQYGAGRVLWMGTEESWRWRDRLGDRVHQTFWLQAMRWGLAARLRGRDTRLQASLDRPLVAVGETAEIRARAVTTGGEPVEAAPALQLDQLDAQGNAVAGSGRLVGMKHIADSAGIWQASLDGLPVGRWRATVSSGHPDLNGLGEVREFQVRDRPGREYLELGADPAALARLAEIGGGTSGNFSQADAILKQIASKLKPRDREETRTNSLWDNYLILILILGLLIGEWAWRKKIGLP